LIFRTFSDVIIGSRQWVAQTRIYRDFLSVTMICKREFFLVCNRPRPLI